MSTQFPEGVYKVEVVKNGVGENHKGNPMVFIQFKVLETIGGQPVANSKILRAYEKVLTENTIQYLAKDIVTLGIKGRDGKPLASFLRLDPQVKEGVDLAGQILVMQCRHKESNKGGELWEEWQAPYAGAGKAYESIAADRTKLGALHQKYGALFSTAIAAASDPAAESDQF